MHARTLFGLILLWPTLAYAAEPDNQSDADESSAGESNTNVTVRVRLVEVSLTNLKNRGLSWAKLDGDASHVIRNLAVLLQKSSAKLMTDETIVVAVGSEARIHAGTEYMPDLPSKAGTSDDEIAFHGTDIVVVPRSQADGRLAIELLCKQSRPIIRADEPPQRRVHEIATVVELAEAEAVVLKGEKDRRVESSVRGAFPHVSAAFGRVTTTYHEIQTFVIVSRGLGLADETAAIVEMQD